jgi:serine/threonine-protein kinase
VAGCPHNKVRPLGEGAVGDVYLCVDVTGRRLVVVKWLRAELNETSDAAARFRREAELMASHHFDGVIKVEDYGSDDLGRTWMAMEFADGLTPAAVIQAGDGWAVHRLIAGVGASLDELHGLGVVHRDLKPDNVIIRSREGGWEPVIIDLGIAKWLSQETATATGSVFGTPHYMSPEQFRDSKHVGPATDRYGLAVIAFELLCGKLPYDGRNLPELLRQHVEAPVPKLSIPRARALRGGRTVPDASANIETLPTPELDRFMQIAMAKAPTARYQGGHEMARAFEAAAKADNLWAPPTSPRPLFDSLGAPILEFRVAGETRRLDIREGPVVLGRHEACQVMISSPRLSRLHACVYTHRGRIWIADLHSQNGSTYRGRPLMPGVPAPLPPGGDQATFKLYDREVTVRGLPG